MKYCFLSLLFLTVISLLNYEFSSTSSSKLDRFVASEHLLKIDGNEELSKGIQEFLSDEQNLHNGAPVVTVNPDFIPENNPKFSLPYYLVPQEDAHLFASDLLDPRVADQLTMKITGKKHFKFFIHPESEAHYDFLHSSYRYIGPDQTEFFASPTSESQSLIVWNKNNSQRKPFIVQIGIDKNFIDAAEIERSVQNQKALDRIERESSSLMNLKNFPESMGLILTKKNLTTSQKLGGLIIQEIPDEIVNAEKKWPSFLVLLKIKKNSKPLIMEVIQKSGLSTYDFFKLNMIDNYFAMFEEISLTNGINFEPHEQNLGLELSSDLKPTGKWVLRKLGGIGPDIIAMAKNKGPIDVYMQEASVVRYRLDSGRANYIKNFAFFYRHKVFDKTLEVVSKYDSDLTPEKIIQLQNDLNIKYQKLIQRYLKIKLINMEELNDAKKIETMILDQAELESKLLKKEAKDSEDLNYYIESKKLKNEWIELSSKKGPSKFYLTDHGLYETENNKIKGLAFFNSNEFFDYKYNNQVLPSLQSYSKNYRKSGCFKVIDPFIKGTK